MTIWPFSHTFLSASTIFSSLSVVPSFYFHSLPLFSGSKWKEGHLSIISLWTYRHISHCTRHHKNQALQLIPRTDCWQRCPADKCWNFQKNAVLLKMLTTCQAECSLAYTWHWGNRVQSAIRERSVKWFRLSILDFIRFIFVSIGKWNKSTVS